MAPSSIPITRHSPFWWGVSLRRRASPRGRSPIPPYISALCLTSYPCHRIQALSHSRSSCPFPSNASRRAETALMLGCHADCFASSRHPSLGPSTLRVPAERGCPMATDDWQANRDVLQAFAGAVDGMTPRMSATGIPMATHVWFWSMGASTRLISHTNLAR
jgi:hypothetical protein